MYMLSNKNVDHENKKLNRDTQNVLKIENRNLRIGALR